MDKKKVLVVLIVLGLLLSIFTLNAGAHYVGSKNLDVYHYPSCHYVDRITPENLIYFDTPEDAIAAGYCPCKVCKPPTKSSTTRRVVDTVEIVVEIVVPTPTPSLSAPLPVHNMNTGENFSKIQAAIEDNDTKDGHTITVYSGVYYENVVVNKSVTLIGNGHPVVDAGGEGSAITLCADGITLIGFTATNSGSSRGCAGITVTSSNNNTITGNNVNNNNDDGIRFWSSSNNIITGNNVNNNNDDGGIYLLSSCNNTITGNNVSNNSGGGISLYYSSNNNTITDNNVSNNNRNGIRLHYSSNNNTITGNVFVNDGLNVEYSYQNTVEDNTVNGKPLVYLEDASDYKVEDAGQVILVNCDNITVENLDLSNTSVGIALLKTENSKISNNIVCNNSGGSISLSYSSNNIITCNNVNNNDDGIDLLFSCNNNTIRGNNVCNNNGYGIHLDISNNNIITGNNVCNNNKNGILLYYSSNNNTITGNNVCNNNRNGILLHASSNNNTITGNVFVNDGLFVDYSDRNTVENNIVNGKPLVYLEDVSDYKVEDAGQVIIVNCNNISIENLDLSNTDVGIVLWKTENSKISNNIVCNNSGGIDLQWDSSNNSVYLNNFMNNSYNVNSYGSNNNIWNSTEKITYIHNGTTYESYLGNYWDDYEGTDADGDGIGDTHYSIYSENDESADYPLMQPFENYNITTSHE